MTKQQFLASVSLSNEKWRDIEGCDGRYSVSSLGRVCSFGGRRKACVLKPYIRADKNKEYASVCIIINGKSTKVRVHRLVAQAFIPNPNGLKEIDHLNGDGTDNRVDNIRWCDRLSNMGNTITRRRLKISSRSRREEKELYDRKIARMKDGVILQVYDSISEIKKEGYNDSCVYWTCNGKHKTHAGYEWKYIRYTE